jgi:hypothetical protein
LDTVMERLTFLLQTNQFGSSVTFCEFCEFTSEISKST